MDAFDKDVRDLWNCPNFQQGSFWAKTYLHPHQPPALPFFFCGSTAQRSKGWTQSLRSRFKPPPFGWTKKSRVAQIGRVQTEKRKDICATWIAANLSHTQKPRKAPGKAVAELVATYPASQLLLIRQRHTGVPAPKLMLWGFPAVEQKVSTSHECLPGMLYHHVISSTSRWWWRSHFLRAQRGFIQFHESKLQITGTGNWNNPTKTKSFEQHQQWGAVDPAVCSFTFFSAWLWGNGLLMIPPRPKHSAFQGYRHLPANRLTQWIQICQICHEFPLQGPKLVCQKRLSTSWDRNHQQIVTACWLLISHCKITKLLLVEPIGF